MLVTEYVDGEEGEHRQHERHGDVAGDVRSAGEEWHDPHQVVYEYEEERCQKVRRIASVVLADAGLDDIILDHGHEHLHHADPAFRSLLARVVPPVPPGRSQHDEQQQGAVDQQSQHVLGDREVPRPDLGAVGGQLDDLVLVFASGGSDVEPFIFPVLQMPGAEDMKTAAGLAHDDHRQRDADRMTLHRGDVPLVGVADVTIEVLVHVECLDGWRVLPNFRRFDILSDRRGQLRTQREREQKANEYVDPLSHHSSTQATTRLSLISTKPEAMSRPSVLSPLR